MSYLDTFHQWCACATALSDELLSLSEKEIADAFYRELTFGTGGLRGIIGAGTNRMNVYTVAKASQGIANYIKKNFDEASRKIAVSYDSRIMSRTFAETASGVFAANGIKVAIYPVLMPTPCLSFATRELNCAAGVMITASHNPAKYNGYKVYGADGCQITTDAAAAIQEEIDRLDIFSDVRQILFSDGINLKMIHDIPNAVYDRFIEQVIGRSVLYGDPINRNVLIVYSPLNGTGREPVVRALKTGGFTNITVVKEQEMPDGHFPTCPYPNPEIKEAMALGIAYAKAECADLLLATDPDCDRVGIAVKNAETGDYSLLTGNEVGLLLLDYICAQRVRHGTMPPDPVIVKTIVTTDLAEKIAAHYGVRVINVLTGFKFIGEQINLLEQAGRINSYIFGFEESYGYLSSSYVRDKDAVNGAYLICEMFAYYKSQGTSLLEKLSELYSTYGYCLNTLHSYQFDGAAGFGKMQNIMKRFRTTVSDIAGYAIHRCLDYSTNIGGLPKSDVLKYVLDCGSVVVRPSGTEPKIKVYISVTAASENEAMMIEQTLVSHLNVLVG